jgi:hypothetical protein
VSWLSPILLVLLFSEAPDPLTIQETVTRNVNVVQEHLALMAADAQPISSSVHLDSDFSVLINGVNGSAPIVAPLLKENVGVFYRPLKINRMQSANCSHVEVAGKIDPSLVGCEISVQEAGQPPKLVSLVYIFNGSKIRRIALVPVRSTALSTNSSGAQ